MIWIYLMAHRQNVDNDVFNQVHFWNFSQSDCKRARENVSNVDDPFKTTKGSNIRTITDSLRDIILIAWTARTNPARNRPLPNFYDMVVALFRSDKDCIIKFSGF